MALPLIAAAIGAAGSLFQTGVGISQMFRKPKRQKIVNPYKNLGISTETEEMMAEAVSRSTATQTEALSKMGSRGAGMIGVVAQQEQERMREIAARLDEKQDRLKQLIAGGEAERQRMQEQRDMYDRHTKNVGAQTVLSGIGNLASSAAQFSRLFPEEGKEERLENRAIRKEERLENRAIRKEERLENRAIRKEERLGLADSNSLDFNPIPLYDDTFSQPLLIDLS